MKLSIIVTTFNESKVIGRCLDSILSQTMPKGYEIIVSCPDEPTGDVVRRYQKGNKNINLIKDPGKGKPVALNMALKKAKGDIIVLTDGDVVLGEDSIRSLLRHFNDNSIGGVSGRVVYESPEDSLFHEWGEVSAEVFDKMRKAQSKRGDFCHPTGYLYAIRNGIVDSIPNNALSDDAVIGYILKSNGYSMKYEPTAKVYVKFPLTIRDFVNQKSRTRAGFIQMRKKFGFSDRKISSEISFGIKDLFRVYGVRKVYKIPLVVAVYVFSWIRAYWVLMRKNRFENVWTPVKSTKY